MAIWWTLFEFLAWQLANQIDSPFGLFDTNWLSVFDGWMLAHCRHAATPPRCQPTSQGNCEFCANAILLFFFLFFVFRSVFVLFRSVCCPILVFFVKWQSIWAVFQTEIYGRLKDMIREASQFAFAFRIGKLAFWEMDVMKWRVMVLDMRTKQFIEIVRLDLYEKWKMKKCLSTSFFFVITISLVSLRIVT